MASENTQKACKLSILGSTGSVGESTLEIVRRHPSRWHIHSLSAYENVDLLWKQCLEFMPEQVVIVNAKAAQTFITKWKGEQDSRLAKLEILQGPDGLVEIAGSSQNDVVMASIVGAAGLPASLAAAESGKRILLANKESLVMSGELFMETVKKHHAELLPIDSEHNAIFQCLASNRGDAGGKKSEIKKIMLTASGGPFLECEKSTLTDVSPEQACKHPKWDMGRKISVDSASLMNKGLEVIEACLLFDLKPGQIEVLIHPESIVHSMVEYCDGSVIAQMANPDMKIPIAYGLAWPERIETGVASLDLLKAGALHFQIPDSDKFPCLALAYRALASGACAINALNAANEVAVDAFLNKQIKFTAIPDVIESVLDHFEAGTAYAMNSLKDVLEVDQKARCLAEDFVQEIST